MSDEVAQVQKELKQRMIAIKDQLIDLETSIEPQYVLVRKMTAFQREGQKLARIYKWLSEE